MQEKVGYVYIIMNDCFKENTVKIGKTMKNPEERCLELYSGNTGIPTQYYVYAALRIANYGKVELALHEYFKDRRINNSREWFNVNPDEVLNIFKVIKSTTNEASIEFYDEQLLQENESSEMVVPNTSYNEFWSKFISKSILNNPLYVNSNGSSRGYIVYNVPNTYGCQINPKITKSVARVELYIYGPEKQINKDQFDYLYAHKDDIEKKYGKSLIWTKLEERIACRIYDEIDRDKSDDEIMDYLSENTLKLYNVLLPYLKEFKFKLN
jgi:hypothetical protein